MERLGRIPEVKIILPIDFHTSSLCWETVVENFAHDNNVLLAQAMGLDEKQLNPFLVTLKTISMRRIEAENR